MVMFHNTGKSGPAGLGVTGPPWDAGFLLETFNHNGSGNDFTDNYLVKTPFEIRIYP